MDSGLPIAVTLVQYQPIAFPFPQAVAPAAPDQPYHQPEIPVQPLRVSWAYPSFFFTPAREATEGSAQGWRTVAPEWITGAVWPRPSVTAFVSSPDTIQIEWWRQPSEPMRARSSVDGWSAPPLLVATGTEFPRVTIPELVRRLSAAPLESSTWNPFTPSATPDIQPSASTFPVLAALRAPLEALSWSTFTPPVPTQFWNHPPPPVRLIARATWTEYAWNPETPVTPVPDIPLTSPVFPVWLKQWHPSRQIESRGPVAPIPTPTIQRVVGIVGAVWEQSCASYIATLRDPQGNILPGSILQTLKVTLYTVNRDNTISIVNSREHQPCLNINDVTVYDALQTTADGRRFNLRWRMQPADTTLIDPTLAFERHLVLWEYTWSAGTGKHEATVVVHNLRVVN